jgi:regulator of sirC expression with transglutaminase-like and TPR domain
VFILPEFAGSVERGMRLECVGQAKDDLERYLQLAPNAEDATAVREQIIDLAKRVVLIH